MSVPHNYNYYMHIIGTIYCSELDIFFPLSYVLAVSSTAQDTPCIMPVDSHMCRYIRVSCRLYTEPQTCLPVEEFIAELSALLLHTYSHSRTEGLLVYMCRCNRPSVYLKQFQHRAVVCLNMGGGPQECKNTLRCGHIEMF